MYVHIRIPHQAFCRWIFNHIVLFIVDPKNATDLGANFSADIITEAVNPSGLPNAVAQILVSLSLVHFSFVEKIYEGGFLLFWEYYKYCTCQQRYKRIILRMHMV